jgi:hypothetical protein
MASYSAWLILISALALPVAESSTVDSAQLRATRSGGSTHLNWTSFYPNGSATGRSGRVNYDLGWGGPNVPDENGSGGMTRRVVLANERGSCTDLCQGSDLWNQACVTKNERGQLPGVPLKGTILLYATHLGFDDHGTQCGPFTRPFNDDFLERSGADGMLNMFEADIFDESVRTWAPATNPDQSTQQGKLAPAKTLEYWRSLNQSGPEPLFIHKLTKPYLRSDPFR